MQILNRITLPWLRRKKKKDPENSGLDPEFQKFELPEPNIEEDDKLNHLINEAARHADRYKAELFADGLEDGKLGLPNTDSAMEKTKTYAKFIVEPIKVYATGKVTEIRNNLKKRERENEDSENQYSQSAFFKRVLDFEFHENPRNYSRRLGWIYIFFALILIIADVPLALDLIHKGLQLPSVPGNNSQIVNFLNDPIQVFQNNWETFLTAIGIAFCTILIKIFYDHFMGISLGKKVIYRKKLQKEFELSDKEMINIKWITWGRNAIKIAILGVSIYGLIILGEFRFQTLRYNLLISLNPGNIDEVELVNQYVKDVGPIVKKVMILLSLIFPMCSGVCASIGLNNLMNSLAANKSESNYRRAKKDWERTINRYEDMRKRLSIWKSYLYQFLTKNQRNVWILNEGSIEAVDQYSTDDEEISQRETDIQKYILAFYFRGYHQGMMEPAQSEKYANLYQRAEILRNKLESKSINAALQTKTTS